MFSFGPISSAPFSSEPISVVDVSVTLTGVQAVGNPDQRPGNDGRFIFLSTQIITAVFPDTEVYVDNVLVATLINAGDTTTVTAGKALSKYVVISKPADVSPFGNSINAAPLSWGGTSFSTRITRYNDSLIQVQSVSSYTEVRIYKGTDVSPTFTLYTWPGNPASADDLFGTYGTQVWTIESDSPIIAIQYSSNGATDSDVLFPESTELYGHGGTLTSSYGASVTTYLSNNATPDSDTVSRGGFASVSGRSADFELGNYTRSIGTNPIAIRTLADSDGGETTVAVGVNVLAPEYVLGEQAEFLAIVAPPEASGKDLRIYNSSNTLLDTFTFSSGGTDRPCALYLAGSNAEHPNLSYVLVAGTKIVSDYPVFIVYDDDTTDDETKLYGFGGYFDNPIAGSAVNSDANISVTGVSATGSVSSVTVTADAQAPVSGLSSSGEVGSVDARSITPVPVTGTTSTGAVGSVSVTADGIIPVTGLSGTGQVGTASAEASSTIPVTGLESVSFVGSVSVVADSVSNVTGISATSQVNGVSVTGTSVVSITGVSGTAEVGSASAEADAVVAVSGLEAVSFVSGVTVVADANAVVSGLESTASVGDAEAITSVAIDVSGLLSSGSVGDTAVTADAVVPVSGVSASGSVGEASVEIRIIVPVTGVSATAQVGAVSVTADANVLVSGVSATGRVRPVLVWGKIVPDQNPEYTGVTPSQSPGWVEETASQTTTWQEVEPAQSPSWSEDTATQSPNWNDIAA